MSSGFITESEALEQRRQRQEEWEKVRTEDQPKEAPEEPYDTRPLFTRLEEQRLKKEAEYEEAHKLKNMIRGLDDDEVGFLDLVEESKAKAAQQISLEEQKEMQEFRERVAARGESGEMRRLRAQLAPPPPPRAAHPAHAARPARPATQQRNKLQGVIVRKRKASDESSDIPAPKQNGAVDSTHSAAGAGAAGAAGAVGAAGAARRCVGVLPGLGHYRSSDSSSDTDSSDTDIDIIEKSCSKSDLLGRRAADTKKEEDHKS